MTGLNNGFTQTWEEFHSARCTCHRDLLICSYFPVVERVARKIHRRITGVELPDLLSFGTFGLIKAVDVYDPFRCVCRHLHYPRGRCRRCACTTFRGTIFETVAAAHIRGHILDEIRSADWAPRSVRRRQREVDHAIETLEAALGREPTLAEISEFLEVEITEVDLRLRETAESKVSSLDEPVSEDGGPVEVEDQAINPLESREIAVIAEYAMRALPPRQRLVISLHYFERMSLPEIASVLGCSSARARDMHTTAVLAIRETLAHSFSAA